MILKENYLERLRTNEVLSLAKFVVLENYNHHLGDIRNDTRNEDILSIYREELSYIKNSEIFVGKNNFHNIMASIRILKWDYKVQLPLEKIFGIDPLKVISDDYFSNIWHIGRFAIKKEIRKVSLFKKLMVCAISPVCKNKDSIAFAECDCKLLRVLSLLGIKTRIIGESINYLGSETVPISMEYNGLLGFYQENMHLVSDSLLAYETNCFFELP